MLHPDLRVAETKPRRRACVRWDGTDDALEAIAELAQADPAQTSVCPAWCWHLVLADGRRVLGWWVEDGQPTHVAVPHGVAEPEPVTVGDWLMWNEPRRQLVVVTEREFAESWQLLP